MKRSVGRPAVKLGSELYIWVLIELMRDTPDKEQRLPIRKAAKKLARELKRVFRGGRVLPSETLRRHHKNFSRKDGQPKTMACELLEIGRQRREFFGWDVSAWLWVINPAQLQAMGFEVAIRQHEIRDEIEIRATRRT